MSIPMHEVADAVRSLKKFTDAVTALGSYVDSVASMDQAVVEASQRLSDKKVAEAQQDERLAKLADAIALAEADVARSQAKASEIHQAAQRGASIITADAKRQADAIVTAAQAEAERLKGPLNRDIADLTAKRAAAADDLAGVRGAVDEARAELDALQAQISKARKAIADLLKG